MLYHAPVSFLYLVGDRVRLGDFTSFRCIKGDTPLTISIGSNTASLPTGSPLSCGLQASSIWTSPRFIYNLAGVDTSRYHPLPLLRLAILLFITQQLISRLLLLSNDSPVPLGSAPTRFKLVMLADQIPHLAPCFVGISELARFGSTPMAAS